MVRYSNGSFAKTYEEWQRIYPDVDRWIAMGMLKEVK